MNETFSDSNYTPYLCHFNGKKAWMVITIYKHTLSPHIRKPNQYNHAFLCKYNEYATILHMYPWDVCVHAHTCFRILYILLKTILARSKNITTQNIEKAAQNHRASPHSC